MAKKNFFNTTSKVGGTLAMVLALVFGLVLAGCPTDSDDSPDPGPGPSGGGVTKQDFEGTWGAANIPTSGEDGASQIVISNVTETGGTLVFTAWARPSGGTYGRVSTTLNFTWGAAYTYTDTDDYDAKHEGFTITGTPSGASGAWSSFNGDYFMVKVFGATGGSLADNVRLYFKDGVTTYLRIRWGSNASDKWDFGAKQ